MNEGPCGGESTLGLPEARRVDELCDAFEWAWKNCNGTPPALEDYLKALPENLHEAAVLELLPIEIAYLRRRGEAIPLDSYRQRFPFAEKYFAQWTTGAQGPQPVWRLAAGDRLGKYTIIHALGSGGMGEVYRAVDSTLRRDVAIKVLHSRHTANAEAIKRIRLEAQTLAALDHEHILAVHELSEQDGLVYMVLELLHGETLAERLKRKALEPDEVLDLAVQLAGALAAAHQKQIVHRDLKPQNIFLTKCDQAKILDFGLASLVRTQAAGPGEEHSPPSAHDQINASGRSGTLGYMSPEQVRGEKVDARSDVFTFGCVLVEMIAGKPLYVRPTRIASDEAILNEPAPQVAELRRGPLAELAPIVVRCLRKPPLERYATALELNQDLASMRAARERKKGRTLRQLERAGLVLLSVVLIILGGWLANSVRIDWKRRAAQAGMFNALLVGDIDSARGFARTIVELGRFAFDPEDPATTRLGAVAMGFLALERGSYADLQEAIDWFQIANSDDRESALAHVGLAECYYRLSSAYVSPDVCMERVEHHAHAALRLDPGGQDKSSAIAHALLGLYYHRYVRDWSAARAQFDLALKINRESTMAARYYGNSLVLQEDARKGGNMLSNALECDAESLDLQVERGLAFLYEGEFDQARDLFDSALALNARHFPAQWAVGEMYLHQALRAHRTGQDAKPLYAKAMVELDNACKLDPASPEAKAEFLFCFAMLRGEDARRRYEINAQFFWHELNSRAGQAVPKPGQRYVPHSALAVAQLGRGDTAAALANLRLGLAQHDKWLIWLKIDPVFDPLRADPLVRDQFNQLCHDVGLWEESPRTIARPRPSSE